MPMPSESNAPVPDFSPAEKEPLIIFGGSFDPVHVGHIAMLRAAMEAVRATRAIILPVYQSPHKIGQPSADARHRLAMLQLALNGLPGVSISEIELNAAKPVYTYDSLQLIHAHHLDDQLVLVIGMDQLRALHQWYRAADILKHVRLLILPRESATEEQTVWQEVTRHWPAEIARRLQADRIPVPAIAISATDIRRRAACRQSISGLVHPDVEQYILAHGLYASRTLPPGKDRS